MGQTKKYREHLLRSLEDPNEAAAYLDACLEDEDPENQDLQMSGCQA
jgi:DNA-binding phage protein